MIEWDEFDAQARALVAVLNAGEARRGTGALWRHVPARGTANSYLRRSPTRVRIPLPCPAASDEGDTPISTTDETCNDDDDPAVAQPPVPQQQEQQEQAGWTDALCEWHVVWSSAFRVPVVHYSLARADGSALSFAAELAYADALAAAHGGPRTGADTAAAYITSGEHPVLGTPFWFLHPCRTAPAMARLAALPAWHRAHYLAAWLSWAAPMVGLAVDVSPVFL